MRNTEGALTRSGWQTLLLLVLAGIAGCWTISQLAPPSLDTRGGKESNRVFPKGSTILERVGSAAFDHTSPYDADDEPLRLLLSTHNRLFWYTPKTRGISIVHEKQGVYYGAFVGDAPSSLWVISRPHNWHPKATEEFLIHLETPSGREIERKKINSRFTHDAIRVGDSVWLANTGEGQLVHLKYPTMEQVEEFSLFTKKQHINTLASLDSSTMWVVLHNLGMSAVSQVDLASGKVIRTIKDVGENCHGLVAWRGRLVLLSSMDTALITLDPVTEETRTVWKGDEGFLKGLIVVDDVAYFGLSPPMQRQDRDGLKVECDLIAVNLNTGDLVFRHKVPTHGLLNLISAPHLAIGSTYTALYTAQAIREPRERAAELGAGLGLGATWSEAWLTERISESVIGGRWSTRMPQMILDNKGTVRPHSTTAPEYVHLGKLPPELIRPVQDKLRNMPQDWWLPDVQATVNAQITGRDANLMNVKPGVNSMHLLFSTRDADHIWELPLYHYFQPVLDPMLHAIIGKDSMHKIVRLQLAQMTPDAHINPHKDKGPWAHISHRVHVVLKTNAEVSFFTCSACKSPSPTDLNCVQAPRGKCVSIAATQDSVFEVDNLLIHEVTNPSKVDRVHLVMDVAEKEMPPRAVLRPGQFCLYVNKASQLTKGC